MRVLVVGGGGREHAIVWKLAQSPIVDEIFCAPGNPGTARLAENLSLRASDIQGLRDWSKSSGVELVIVGPEEPLAAGIADALQEDGIRCFGPSAAAARIESSKAWAKRLMVEAGIPTASFGTFEDAGAALEHLRRRPLPVVIKADGLTAGKGVTVAESRADAETAVRALMIDGEFGGAGRVTVIEDCLEGQELSAFALSDGRSLKMLPCARDFKRAYDGDAGPNTGSMGCYSPVGMADAGLIAEIEARVMRPALAALAEMGNAYVGFLYAGLMIADDGPRVLEFNCRLGDPEAQAILPLVDGDLAEACLLALEGQIEAAELGTGRGATCCVVMASGGYPGRYATGHAIGGLEDANSPALVFHAGTAERDGAIVTAGGRVLSVVGRGENLAAARRAAYDGVGRIEFKDAHYRTDIGALDPERIAIH